MAARAAETRRNRGFPAAGRPWAEFKAEMPAARGDDSPRCRERRFAAASFAGEDVLRCANEGYDAYRTENGLFAACACSSLADLAEVAAAVRRGGIAAGVHGASGYAT